MWFVKQYGCHSNFKHEAKVDGKSFKYSGPLRFVPWFVFLMNVLRFLKTKEMKHKFDQV